MAVINLDGQYTEIKPLAIIKCFVLCFLLSERKDQKDGEEGGVYFGLVNGERTERQQETNVC